MFVLFVFSPGKWFEGLGVIENAEIDLFEYNREH